MILDDVIYLFDLKGQPLRALPLSAEWKLEDFQESTNKLEVRIPADETGKVITDQDLVFRGRRFSITAIEYDRDTGEIILSSEEIQAALADANLATFDLKNETIGGAFRRAFAKAPGWTVGDIYDEGLKFNAELVNVSVLFISRFLERQSGGRLIFDTGRRIVHLVKGDEYQADVAFRYGQNVANINKTQTSPQATVLFPYGRDGMTIEAITGGKKYIENFSWYTGLGLTIEEARERYTKELTWSDDRYIYNANLYRDAETRLSLLSQPQINYTLTKANVEGVELGMVAYVSDEELDIRVKVVAGKIIRSSNPEENEIELDYIPPSLGATLDNEYSGDTNTGGSGQTSFFLQKNASLATIGSVPTAVITADITVYSATAFEMGLAMTIEVKTAGLLEGYFQLDGERLPTEIKQTVAVGWYTFGLPFVVTGVQEGTKTLRFYLTMPSGSAEVPQNKAEFYVKASGVYGGDSNEKPDRIVVENIKEPQLQVTALTDALIPSGVTFTQDLPRRFGVLETVTPYVDPAPFVAESNVVFLDPAAEPDPVVAPAEKTRETFAIMADYERYTNRPTQAAVDKFIDQLHTTDELFKVVTFAESLYVFATTGTVITVDAAAKRITSDGDLFVTTKDVENENIGSQRDWINQAGLLREREVFSQFVASTREEFAIMTNYSAYSTPEQTAVDEFINVTHAEKGPFALYILNQADVLIFASAGTYLAYDELTNQMQSDGDIYYISAAAANTLSPGGMIYQFAETDIVERSEEFTRIFEPEEPADPTLRTREEFANMENYPQFGSKASSAGIDDFIDTVHPTNNIFMLISLTTNYLYALTTAGTYIDVNEETGVITSDGAMYSRGTDTENRSRGTSIDWSGFMPVIKVETYIRN